MEKYQMNRPGCRPYNNTCGMTRPQNPTRMGMADRSCQCDRQPETFCSCHMPGAASPNAEMFSHLKHLPLAMAYVPCQEYNTTFDLCYALKVGTIFPELCKPFCGKRGGCR